MKTIGQIIREKRKEKGLTVIKLAEIIGASKNTISNWEHDRTQPSLFVADALADAFGCSLDELVGRKPRPPKEEKGRYR